MYSLILNNKNIQLPNYSFGIAERLEECSAINSSERTYKDKCLALYDFEKDLLGEDKISELVGDFETCDPNDIQLLFMGIVSCYNQPIEKKRNEQINNALSKIDIDKISKIMEHAGELK